MTVYNMKYFQWKKTVPCGHSAPQYSSLYCKLISSFKLLIMFADLANRDRELKFMVLLCMVQELWAYLIYLYLDL